MELGQLIEGMHGGGADLHNVTFIWASTVITLTGQVDDSMFWVLGLGLGGHSGWEVHLDSGISRSKVVGVRINLLGGMRIVLETEL